MPRRMESHSCFLITLYLKQRNTRKQHQLQSRGPRIGHNWPFAPSALGSPKAAEEERVLGESIGSVQESRGTYFIQSVHNIVPPATLYLEPASFLILGKSKFWALR